MSDSNKKDDKSGISINSIRNTFYSRYESELKKIWEHSVFVWGFEVLLFTGYGYLVANFFLKHDKDVCIRLFYCNIVAIVLALIGLCISSVWIALAKASKARQEAIETLIVELEGNPEYFKYPRVFAMGGFHNRMKKLDQALYTTEIGKYSPGKLNIFIAQFSWLIWCVLEIVHLSFLKIFSPFHVCIISFAIPVLLYVLFIYLLNTKCKTYLEKEDYGTDYIFDMYNKVEMLIERLGSINSFDLDGLKNFIVNELSTLNFIWDDKFTDDFDREEYRSLISDFKMKYIEGYFLYPNQEVNRPKIMKYKNQVNERLVLYKQYLKEHLYV